MSPLLLPKFSTPSSSFNFVPPPPPVTIRPPALRCCHSPPSISTPEATLTNILNSGVIACLRAQSPDVALEAARAAITAGISVLEIVVSTPGFTSIGARISNHNSRSWHCFEYQGC